MMSMNVESCCLIRLDRPQRIHLPHDCLINLGRSPSSRILDIKCSRKQGKVSVKADYKSGIVNVKHNGDNPSIADGHYLYDGQEYIAGDGTIIELLPGLFRYQVQFVYGDNANKREQPDLEHESRNIKKLKCEQQSAWEDVNGSNLLIYTSESCQSRNKVASFDLDWTLIKTKSGNVYPTDNKDWMLWHPCIKEKLKSLVENDYKIVIFSNQKNLGTGTSVTKELKVLEFKSKVEEIERVLAVPIQLFISTSSDIFRKPAPGMWKMMLKKNVCPIEEKSCFFVGDGAGRPAGWEPGKKKDFSMSDRLFASNIGIAFHTPDEFFMNKPQAPFESPLFHPSAFGDVEEPDYKVPSTGQEVILMVGSPASGKTYFARNNLIKKGYLVVSRDVLGSWQKCTVKLETFVKRGHSVVVDNTNPDVISRKRYVDVCQRYNVRIRCFVMDVSLERCIHNNKYRQINTSVAPANPVTDVIIKTYRKLYTEPTLDEGFAEILKIPFVPYFLSEYDENLYKMYLTSK